MDDGLLWSNHLGLEAVSSFGESMLIQKCKASLTYLCTPTDLHVVSQEAHEASVQEYKKYPSRHYCILMKLLGNGKFLRAEYLPLANSKIGIG